MNIEPSTHECVPSSLILPFAAARLINGAATDGAAAELNIYKQTDDVTFMREEGVIAEYQLTGLGATYARFSGEVNRLYYKGGGVRLLLNLQPESGNGFFANLSMGEHSYERIAARSIHCH